jgi:hypothetical protein
MVALCGETLPGGKGCILGQTESTSNNAAAVEEILEVRAIFLSLMGTMAGFKI